MGVALIFPFIICPQCAHLNARIYMGAALNIARSDTLFAPKNADLNGGWLLRLDTSDTLSSFLDFFSLSLFFFAKSQNSAKSPDSQTPL